MSKKENNVGFILQVVIVSNSSYFSNQGFNLEQSIELIKAKNEYSYLTTKWLVSSSIRLFRFFLRMILQFQKYGPFTILWEKLQFDKFRKKAKSYSVSYFKTKEKFTTNYYTLFWKRTTYVIVKIDNKPEYCQTCVGKPKPVSWSHFLHSTHNLWATTTCLQRLLFWVAWARML